MYFAKFKIESETWGQAMVRWMPSPTDAMPEFQQLLNIPEANLTVRFDLQPDKVVVLIAVATRLENSEIAQFALESWVEQNPRILPSAAFASDALERDLWLEQMPMARAKVAAEYRTDGASLLCDYLVFPMVEELFATAVTKKSRLVFQANCRKIPLPPDSLRQVRKNYVRLEALQGVPPHVRRHQQQVMSDLPNRIWAVEEFVATETPGELDWVKTMVRGDFLSTFAQLGFPPVDLEDGEWAGCLQTGFHSSLLDTDAGASVSAARVRQEQMENLLCVTPPQPVQLDAHQAASRSALPADEITFDAFISYSSKDRHIASAICHFLEQAGIRCWIAPRDIHTGEIWAEAIPRGIRSSRLLVVIFSGSANLSDHVLREIERAVHFKLTILPFRIEDVEMTEAMSYLLGVPHWFDAMNPPLEAHLARLVNEVLHHLTAKNPSNSQPRKEVNPA